MSALDDASAPTCVSCGNAIDKIKEVYGAGGAIYGGELRASTLNLSVIRGTFLATGTVVLAPQDVRLEAGAQLQHIDGDRINMTFEMRRSRGHWLMIAVKREA